MVRTLHRRVRRAGRDPLVVEPVPSRHLDWHGCVNVRDLGGLPLAGGGVTRSRVVVRADDVQRLSDEGWERLRAHGTRTVVDLRFPDEGGRPAASVPAGIRLVNVPLFGPVEHDATARIDHLLARVDDEVDAVAAVYLDALGRYREHIADAVTAIARAVDHGGVVVHCAVGKDRTGIVAALLLRLAGVAPEDVADDYALSHDRVGAIVRPWLEDVPIGPERERRRLVAGAPRAAMLRVLETIDAAHGDPRELLARTAADGALLDALAAALRGR